MKTKTFLKINFVISLLLALFLMIRTSLSYGGLVCGFTEIVECGIITWLIQTAIFTAIIFIIILIIFYGAKHLLKKKKLLKKVSKQTKAKKEKPAKKESEETLKELKEEVEKAKPKEKIIKI